MGHNRIPEHDLDLLIYSENILDYVRDVSSGSGVILLPTRNQEASLGLFHTRLSIGYNRVPEHDLWLLIYLENILDYVRVPNSGSGVLDIDWRDLAVTRLRFLIDHF
jgi:hypothetical protein